MTAAVRIANCSGFYGDRVAAAKEMVEGGPIDYLTGDWLAELTMLILSRAQAKRAGGGYARTFVTQMEQVMIGLAASWSRAVTPWTAAGTFGYRASTSRSLGRTAGSGAA